MGSGRALKAEAASEVSQGRLPALSGMPANDHSALGPAWLNRRSVSFPPGAVPAAEPGQHRHVLSQYRGIEGTQTKMFSAGTAPAFNPTALARTATDYHGS